MVFHLGIARKKLSLVVVVTLAIVAMVALASAAQIFVAYKSLSSFASDAEARQRMNLRIAATTLKNDQSDAIVEWTANGDASRIILDRVPEFTEHGLVDEMTRLTGATTTIFGYDSGRGEFVRKTTSVRKADGSRAVGTALDKSGPVHTALLAGKLFTGKADILGEAYYTAYMPIYSRSGEISGALYTGVKRADVDGNIDAWMRSVSIVSLLVLAAFSAAAVLLARRILRPLTDLSGSVANISKGDIASAVPHMDRSDEIGRLAGAVERFREAAIERERLEESAQAERQRELQRQTALEQLVSRFRGLIGEIVMLVDTESRQHERHGAEPERCGVSRRADRGIGADGGLRFIFEHQRRVGGGGATDGVHCRNLGPNQLDKSTGEPGDGTCAPNRSGYLQSCRACGQGWGHRRDHPQHRSADQFAGLERHNRSGARRRSRQRLCCCGFGGQDAGRTYRDSDG